MTPLGLLQNYGALRGAAGALAAPLTSAYQSYINPWSTTGLPQTGFGRPVPNLNTMGDPFTNIGTAAPAAPAAAQPRRAGGGGGYNLPGFVNPMAAMMGPASYLQGQFNRPGGMGMVMTGGGMAMPRVKNPMAGIGYNKRTMAAPAASYAGASGAATNPFAALAESFAKAMGEGKATNLARYDEILGGGESTAGRRTPESRAAMMQSMAAKRDAARAANPKHPLNQSGGKPPMWGDSSRGMGGTAMQVMTPVNLNDPAEVERWNKLNPDRPIGGSGGSNSAPVRRDYSADSKGGYRDRYTRNMGYLEDAGSQERRDINEQFDRLAAQQRGELTSRGLASSTILQGNQRAIDDERAQAIGRLNDRLTNQRVATDSALSGDTLAFMERREDEYPSIDQYANLMLQLAQSGMIPGMAGGMAGMPGMMGGFPGAGIPAAPKLERKRIVPYSGLGGYGLAVSGNAHRPGGGYNYF